MGYPHQARIEPKSKVRTDDELLIYMPEFGTSGPPYRSDFSGGSTWCGVHSCLSVVGWERKQIYSSPNQPVKHENYRYLFVINSLHP